MDSIREDKVLKTTHLDLQKTFPDIPCVSQMLGGPALRLGTPKERLSIQEAFDVFGGACLRV